MQRKLVIALILFLAAAAAGFLFFFQGDPAPLPIGSGEPEVETGASEVETIPVRTDGGGRKEAIAREAVAVRRNPLFDDPEIRAGLCGFKGRVVDARKQPVADCGVRMYRGALDSLLKVPTDLFAELPEYEPDYIAGEVQTREDGTFLIADVWPRGMFLMFAGLGTDAPTHKIITTTPSAGEIVDLGDVVLNDAGVIVGTVFDDDGNPMAGALVRAADIPGALAAFFPAERFDPEGAVLVREERAPVRVVRMPAWVKRAFEHLPIPTTRSGSDGSFRLVGVMPGSNMLAVTAKEYLSHVKSSVQVRAAEEKNVGKVRMRRGEELYAKVVDEKGEPVAGAEVFAGSTLSMVPVDLATYLGTTNEAGEIEGTGFSPGKVSVAARRSKDEPWVLAEPQSIISDVVVTLPASYGVTVSVTMPDGTPAEQPQFKLLVGEKGEGATEMYMLGFAPPVELDGRMRKLGEGQWQIDGLQPSPYMILAEVRGVATGSGSFKITGEDATVAIELEEPDVFAIRVVDQDEQPIRNATIFAEARGGRLSDVPSKCGHTDENGQLTVDKIKAETLRVSADHPKYGVVHAEAKQDEECVIKLLAPGTLTGILSENGKPPLPGKYSVAVMQRRNGGPRGPLGEVPQLVTAGVDGRFRVTNLQPGNYFVGAMQSLDALRSPGGLFEFGQQMYMNRDFESERVDVASGVTSEVRIEVGEKPLEGPTAQLIGSVTLNGRLGSGCMVTAYADNRRFVAEVDERGQFNFGTISAGKAWINVEATRGGVFLGPGSRVWSTSIELAEGEQRELIIDVMTGSISGTCYKPDGSPATGLRVSANGELKGGSGRSAWLSESVDSNGAFEFDQVAEGKWDLEVRGGSGDERWRAQVEDVEVSAGVPVVQLRIDLQAAMMVKGRVDLSVLTKETRWQWVGFYESKNGTRGNYKAGLGVGREGKFTSDDLSPGSYVVVLHAQFEDETGNHQQDYECGIVDIPPQGVTDLVLTPRVN